MRPPRDYRPASPPISVAVASIALTVVGFALAVPATAFAAVVSGAGPQPTPPASPPSTPSPTTSGPPGPTLTPKQLRRYWHNAQEILYEMPPKQLHDEWMFGSRRFPDNTGYAMGTALIHSLRTHHPHMSWAALTRLDSQSILDLSDFRP